VCALGKGLAGVHFPRAGGRDATLLPEFAFAARDQVCPPAPVAAGATWAKVARRRLCFGYSEGMSKRKNKELSQPPAPPLGQVLNDFMIDMKVEELRHTISILETRASELLRQKGNPPSMVLSG
jgi:hypothetical protein